MSQIFGCKIVNKVKIQIHDILRVLIVLQNQKEFLLCCTIFQRWWHHDNYLQFNSNLSLCVSKQRIFN